MKSIEKERLQAKVRGEIRFDEPLKYHTSFRVGGPAEVLIIPQDIQDLKEILKYLNEKAIDYSIFGNGTNLLVPDNGIDGVVIKLAGTINNINIEGDTIYTGAGATLPTVAKRATKHGLSGLEFAAGLPATVGGATVMNAGLGTGNDMSTIISKVRVLTKEGKMKILNREDCNFSYRKSRFQTEDLIIVEVEFLLEPGDQQKIESKMKELVTKRKESQPLTMPNAGCIFKNPTGDSAGRLIDEAGGKGLSVGGAEVSKKHANFIVNTGEATAQDILKLMERVQNLIKEEYGFDLEREVQILSSRR